MGVFGVDRSGITPRRFPGLYNINVNGKAMIYCNTSVGQYFVAETSTLAVDPVSLAFRQPLPQNSGPFNNTLLQLWANSEINLLLSMLAPSGDLSTTLQSSLQQNNLSNLFLSYSECNSIEIFDRLIFRDR